MSRTKLFLAALAAMSIASANPQGAVQQGERAAAEDTVRQYEHACEQFDFSTANFLLAPNARWIEDSYPASAQFTGQGWSKHWEEMKKAKVKLHYQIRDLETHIRGDVAWLTLSLDTVASADTADAIRVNGNEPEWRGTFVESYVLLKDHGAWKIVLGHTSLVPIAAGANGK